MGTWGYMSPEQWKTEELTAATDQYALGVMTYALVTGRMPFEAPTPVGHHAQAPQRNARLPPHMIRRDVPEAVTQVIERALAKKPEDRFPTVTAFAQAFDSAIRGNTGEKTNYFTTPILRKPTTIIPATPSRPPTGTASGASDLPSPGDVGDGGTAADHGGSGDRGNGLERRRG